jgi:hypothetical protein
LRGLTSPTGTLLAVIDLPTTRFSYESRRIKQVAPGGEPLVVVLDDGTRVTGEFRDLPEDATVHATMIPGSERDSGRLVLEGGHFERRGPSAGAPATFVFRTKGFPPILHEEATPFGPEEVRDLGIFAFEAQNPLKGRVVDGRQQPLRGIKVAVHAPWSERYARTDALGDFEFIHMPERPIPIRISARGYGTRDFTLLPTSQYTRQSFQLDLAGRLRIVLTDPYNQPGGNLTVRIHELPSQGQPSTPIRTARDTDEGGRLDVTLPKGTYQIRILHTGSRLWGLENVQIEPGAVKELRIALKRGEPPKTFPK